MPLSTTNYPAWLSPFPLQSNKFTSKPPTILTSFKTSNRTTVPRRRARINITATNTQQLQVVTVPDESHMLTPGEVRHVSLDYSLFQTILQSGTTTFGLLNIQHWLPCRGCVLSILNIRNLLPHSSPQSPRVEVECRCSGRFDTTTHSTPPPPWTLLSSTCTPISDWVVYEPNDRQQLADAEWRLWNSCREVAKLMRKVATPQTRVFVEHELAVWAPKEYDRKVSPDEWRATPLVTRQVWCQRAESFSFGVLRCMHASEDIMARARDITSTLERLELGVECVELRRARIQAEISLRDVFN